MISGTVIAVDPGPERSAIVHYDPRSKAVLESFYEDNASALKLLREAPGVPFYPKLAIEMIASYGMPVGKEVFETCVWIGRFIGAWEPRIWKLIYRKDVKLHLCGSVRAKDGNVRAALLDKFGAYTARGTKKSPGPLYGISGDKWAALAVAVTWAETRSDSDSVSLQGVVGGIRA
jgi:hypothetical protein